MNGDPHAHKPVLDKSPTTDKWILVYGDTIERVSIELGKKEPERDPTHDEIRDAFNRAKARHDEGSRIAADRERLLDQLYMDALDEVPEEYRPKGVTVGLGSLIGATTGSAWMPNTHTHYVTTSATNTVPVAR